eukprot:TRINITY_DN13364_c0_g1_i1.p1 TRINITY_DN13364_c0_g1~~TRINITY_DN13364_c0_g1_i1.p1  ORF type:complete len:338 (+),score=92.37 TRINITY_DN13364_c0_g1_i1:69-1082(+)
MCIRDRYMGILNSDTTFETQCKNFKAEFAKMEAQQIREYAADLESNLAINKAIISELVKKHVWSLQDKRVIEKLLQENSLLQDNVKKLMKERDDIQARLLISQQTNNNYKEREKDLISDMEHLKQQFMGQLTRKTYMLQSLEQKHDQALEVLKELAKKDQQIKKLLAVLNIDCNSASVKSESLELPKEFNGRSYTTTSEHFEKPCKERTYSMNVEGRCTEEGKRVLETEVENLKKKVNELHGVNLKLNEALRISNEKIIGLCTKQVDAIDMTELLGAKTLKRWYTTYVKGKGDLHTQKEEGNFAIDTLTSVNEAANPLKENSFRELFAHLQDSPKFI